MKPMETRVMPMSGVYSTSCSMKRNENVAHAQLVQAISDSVLLRIQHAGNVANMWATIVMEHDQKGHMMQVDLCRRMMEKQAKETDDIRAHLDDMALMYE